MKRREFIGAGLVLGASVPLRGWSDVIGNAGDIAAKSLDGADAKVEQMRGIWRELEPMTQGFYTNYEGKGTADARYRDNFGPNLERLVALKAKYDPGNLFRLNANVPPKL